MSQESEFVATGRRKTAVARVRMTTGSGQIKVNGRPFEEYFPTRPLQQTVLKPFEVANAGKTYDISVNASGGGINGQAGAVCLAVSRALIQADETRRPGLKVEGLLTRDPRMKERKKSGQPGARKRFQFSKR
jgi:small subunit ribosomal protein S9